MKFISYGNNTFTTIQIIDSKYNLEQVKGIAKDCISKYFELKEIKRELDKLPSDVFFDFRLNVGEDSFNILYKSFKFFNL